MGSRASQVICFPLLMPALHAAASQGLGFALLVVDVHSLGPCVMQITHGSRVVLTLLWKHSDISVEHMMLTGHCSTPQRIQMMGGLAAGTGAGGVGEACAGQRQGSSSHPLVNFITFLHSGKYRYVFA